MENVIIYLIFLSNNNKFSIPYFSSKYRHANKQQNIRFHIHSCDRRYVLSKLFKQFFNRKVNICSKFFFSQSLLISCKYVICLLSNFVLIYIWQYNFWFPLTSAKRYCKIEKSIVFEVRLFCYLYSSHSIRFQIAQKLFFDSSL